MKKIFSIITLAILISISNSCTKDWLDVNKDPNNAESATAELILPSGVVSLGAQVGGSYNLLGGFWSQYWTQSNAANQYKYLDQYQISSSDFNTTWREMYAGALGDLELVLNDSKSKENWALYLMATVMQSYGFQVMVDLYDKVPYSERFQGITNLNPKFDDGQTIYKDLIVRIDEAMSKEMNLLTEKQKKADFLFNGDMDKWMQFANTLKLKMYLRMVYAEPSFAQAGITSLYSSGANFLSEDASLDIFLDEANKDNPLYESDRRALNVATNLRVTTTIFKYLETNSDPRMATVVQSNTLPEPPGGTIISSEQLDNTKVAIFRIGATDPVFFISEVESYLLQAEAIEWGWGTGDAKSLYDQAVLADFTRKGFDGSSFIASSGVYEYPYTGTFEQKQKAIIMAKWVAFAGSQGIESFFETNRTGYPQVSAIPAWKEGAINPDYQGGELTYSLVGSTGGAFPKRMIYPQDEVNLNINCPAQTVVTDKVWWDKK